MLGLHPPGPDPKSENKMKKKKYKEAEHLKQGKRRDTIKEKQQIDKRWIMKGRRRSRDLSVCRHSAKRNKQ